MFRKLLTKTVSSINFFHDFVLSFNDRFGIALTDKQLHFLFVGIIGIILLIIIHPLFEWLVNKVKSLMVVSWIYVFSLLVALTLAIEIGQKITGSGDMDFADIVAGIAGFFIMSAIYLIGRKIYQNITKKEDNK